MADERSILVIEDDFETRNVLSEVLAEEGYQVWSAANGKEALERLQGPELPALILLDLMMPVMDGWQFRTAQLSDTRLAPIPVIVVSGDSSAEDQAAWLDPVQLPGKPIHLDRLLDIVRQTCPTSVPSESEGPGTTRE